MDGTPRQRATVALRRILTGGTWRDGRETALAVRRAADCSHLTVLRALYALGGEVDHHGSGGSRWRLR